jgi:dihydropteroate synthase
MIQQLEPIKPTILQRNKAEFVWGSKTYIMGILNVTPDSFSDGGEFNQTNFALAQAQKMIINGADILDIGGQSTRPGAKQISREEELNRVIPIIKAIRTHENVPISIDTTRAEVAEKAIAEGADIINDISGATYDSQMLATAAKLEVPIILMHIKGTPQTMQSMTDYQNLVMEIMAFLQQQIDKAIAHKIKPTNIIIDPGIGFAKDAEQNIQLIQQLSAFKSLNKPLLIGVSRKSFIGKIIGKENPKERIWGTAAACCGAIANGADIIRVHDVPEMFDMARVADTIWRNSLVYS